MSKTNEWEILKKKFGALVRDGSVSTESIDEIFDVQFRRRFAKLMNQAARRNSKTVYFDQSHDHATSTSEPEVTLAPPTPRPDDGLS